jgi:hypothetical protein
MADRIEEIKARVAAASPGPWEWADWNTDDGPERDTLQYVRPLLEDEKAFWGRPGSRWEHGRVIGITGCRDCAGDTTESDKEFLAHAREDIPWLLAQLSDLKAREAQAIQKYHDEIKRGRLACEEFVRQAKAEAFREAGKWFRNSGLWNEGNRINNALDRMAEEALRSSEPRKPGEGES